MKANYSDTIEIRESSQKMDIYVNGVSQNLTKINGYQIKGFRHDYLNLILFKMYIYYIVLILGYDKIKYYILF